MLYAYDTFLQEVVPSELAAQNSADETYRYECACCGEEVLIAAKHSNSMVAHFRHRSGNNDVNCEKYLGKYGLVGANSRIRKKDREKVEFYFNSITKCFYIGFRFNENEISNYEKENISIEIRTYGNTEPFFEQKIDRKNFSADCVKLVMLETFSPVYYISNSFNPNKRTHMIFRENTPSFFKIQGERKDYNAKLVRSDTLYTGIRYFVALVGGNGAQLKLRKLPGVVIEQEFDFVSMRNHIWASVITIIDKTSEIEGMLKQWGYKLDTSESITLLWPPASDVDGITVISTNNAFLSSSFKLQPYGNINTASENIQTIDSNITRINVDKLIKITKKNAELEVSSQNSIFVLQENKVEQEFVKKIFIPEKNRHYLFSESGVRKLEYGEKIVLTPTSYVCEYSNGCLTRIIKSAVDRDLNGEDLLVDIIKHYKVVEPYNRICDDGMPNYIVKYIKNCEKTGLINSLVKKYIEEGKL